jgi:Fe-S-cluster containining protein
VPIFNSPELCFRCSAKCCRYFMLQIDTPTSKSDFENIRWYLCHFDTTVFVEKRAKWFLHVQSPCRHLNVDGRCGVYEKRPQICRVHNPSDCEFESEYSAKMKFSSLDQLDDYIARRFSKDRKSEKAKLQFKLRGA